jgi:hypothetical protein
MKLLTDILTRNIMYNARKWKYAIKQLHENFTVVASSQDNASWLKRFTRIFEHVKPSTAQLRRKLHLKINLLPLWFKSQVRPHAKYRQVSCAPLTYERANAYGQPNFG